MSDAEISAKVSELFDMRPHAIEQRLKLRNPIYQMTAAYGHVGRKPVTATWHSKCVPGLSREVELFTWEKLDRVDDIRKAFGL